MMHCGRYIQPDIGPSRSLIGGPLRPGVGYLAPTQFNGPVVWDTVTGTLQTWSREDEKQPGKTENIFKYLLSRHR